MISLYNASRLSGRVQAVLLPGVEACLALWAARAPEAEPLALASGQLTARLPRCWHEEVLRLDAAVPDWPLLGGDLMYLDGAHGPESVFEVLTRWSLRDLQALVNDEGGSTSVQLPLRRAYRAGGRVTAATLFALIEVLKAFWEERFAEVWEIQRETLEHRVDAMNRSLGTTPARSLETFTPRAWAAQSDDTILVAAGQVSGSLDCGSIPALEIFPSLWLRRRIVLTTGGSRLGVCLRAPMRGRRELLPERRVVEMLKVLGDARRFEILRLCLGRPHCTQELAEILSITEGPVSRHLRELERAGLVIGQRAGRFVMYCTIPEMLDLLAEHLAELPGTALSAVPDGRAAV